ncbi:MAG: helix-turn-helix domain-containing protein [Candidatus Hermodarchaeota archaeon]
MMKEKNKEKGYIEILKKTGLNEKEALIYLTLLKSGPKGNIVKDLNHFLTIERTTIYSVLRKLIELGYVKEAEASKSSNKATTFIAIEPSKFFEKLIVEKQKELNEFQNLKKKYLDQLQFVYQNGIIYEYKDLDPFIQPYIKPLLDMGWKIVSYYKKREMPAFNYLVYDCMLLAPNAKIIKVNSFHIFVFDYNIQEDKNALRFFINGIKKITKEIVLTNTDLKDVELLEDEIIVFGNRYPSIKININPQDLKLLGDYFLGLLEEVKENSENESEEFNDVFKSVILPLKNKIFFLWAESIEFLEEMAASIFDIENIQV